MKFNVLEEVKMLKLEIAFDPEEIREEQICTIKLCLRLYWRLDI